MLTILVNKALPKKNNRRLKEGEWNEGEKLFVILLPVLALATAVASPVMAAESGTTKWQIENKRHTRVTLTTGAKAV